MRRLFINVILAGMLTAALLSSSCASRRYSSLTAVRSDSLSASVTERTIYEPVPRRTADLKVSAEGMTRLLDLPEGFGMNVRTHGMNLSLTSDGQGGVNVTAEADSMGREVNFYREENNHRIRDETAEEEDEDRNSAGFCWWYLVPALLIALAAAAILKRKGSNS